MTVDDSCNLYKNNDDSMKYLPDDDIEVVDNVVRGGGRWMERFLG
jgi:hypothetical protein